MLEAGIDWRPELGARSRPIGREVPIGIEQLPRVPRRAPDGSVFCVACPRSLRLSPKNQKILCSECSTHREAFRARRHRVRKAAHVTGEEAGARAVAVSVDDAHSLLEAISDLQAAVGAALARKGRPQGEWHDQLLSAAKHVDVTADPIRQSVADSGTRPGDTS